MVYEGLTEHTEANGAYSTYGAAWGRATLQEAQNAARSNLFRSLGSTPLNPTLAGPGPGGGIVLDASGCDHAHGAIAVTLKTNGSNDGQWRTLADGVFKRIDAVLADSTEAASSQAIAECKARFQGAYQDVYKCHVVVRW